MYFTRWSTEFCVHREGKSPYDIPTAVQNIIHIHDLHAIRKIMNGQMLLDKAQTEKSRLGYAILPDIYSFLLLEESTVVNVAYTDDIVDLSFPAR